MQLTWIYFRVICFELIDFYSINKQKNCCFPCGIVFFGSLKLIEYLASAFIVVSLNLSVRPLPRIRISFLLSICTEDLLSTPNIIHFSKFHHQLMMNNFLVHHIQYHIQNKKIYHIQKKNKISIFSSQLNSSTQRTS